MSIDLAGKPIAITGASSGIGAATAIECARAGMPVALGARRGDKLAAVAARVRELGGRAVTVTMDAARRDDNQRLIEAAVSEFGSLYAVFANAGYGCERHLHEMPESELRAIFDVNFFGTMRTVWAALPHIFKNEFVGKATRSTSRGHVLICSSCLSNMTLPYYGAYSATKAAQHHVGRSMRMELNEHGIHVSTVHPVGTKTEFFDQVKSASGIPKLVNHSTDRFMQTPEFVARHVLRSLRRPRAEVWTGFTGRLVRVGMACCAALPGVEDWWLRKMVHERARNHRDHQATLAAGAAGAGGAACERPGA